MPGLVLCQHHQVNRTHKISGRRITKMSTTNTYMLTMTDQQAAQAAETLTPLGVKFDPPLALISINEKSSREYHLTGSDASDLVELINNELNENGVKPLLPDFQGNLTLQQTVQLMNIAWSAFDWDEDEIFGMASENSYREDWQTLVERSPELFGEAPPTG